RRTRPRTRSSSRAAAARGAVGGNPRSAESARLTLARRSGMQRGVLTGHRVGDRRIETAHPVPFLLGPRPAIAADLVDAPIDLQPVAIGVAEFDGELAAGAPAPLEIDLDPMFAQMIAGAHHLLQCRNLEGDMVELNIFRDGS